MDLLKRFVNWIAGSDSSSLDNCGEPDCTCQENRCEGCRDKECGCKEENDVTK